MIFFLNLVYTLKSLPEGLAGYYTRFLLSNNTKYGVDLDNSSKTFYISELDKSDTSLFRINKDGDYFTFKNRSMYVCEKSKTMSLCKKPSLFKFKSVPLGFQILSSGSGYCLTSEGTLKFKECEKNNLRQIFVFDLETALSCHEPTFYVDEKEPIKPKVPLTYTQKKAIMDKEMKKLKIKDPETQRVLGKSWFGSGWGMPKFPFC